MAFGPPRLEIPQSGSPGREFSAAVGFGDGRLAESFLAEDVASAVHPATGIAAAAAASLRKRRRVGPPDPPAAVPADAGSCVMRSAWHDLHPQPSTTSPLDDLTRYV